MPRTLAQIPKTKAPCMQILAQKKSQTLAFRPKLWLHWCKSQRLKKKGFWVPGANIQGIWGRGLGSWGRYFGYLGPQFLCKEPGLNPGPALNPCNKITVSSNIGNSFQTRHQLANFSVHGCTLGVHGSWHILWNVHRHPEQKLSIDWIPQVGSAFYAVYDEPTNKNNTKKLWKCGICTWRLISWKENYQ